MFVANLKSHQRRPTFFYKTSTTVRHENPKKNYLLTGVKNKVVDVRKRISTESPLSMVAQNIHVPNNFLLSSLIPVFLYRHGGARNEYKLLGGRAGRVLSGRARRRVGHAGAHFARRGRVLSRDTGVTAKRVLAAGKTDK